MAVDASSCDWQIVAPFAADLLAVQTQLVQCMQRIPRPPSLAETVLGRLRSDIVRGALGLGELLSERVLAEKLGVSKTPVREALAQLRQEGLVRIVPQRGAFVFSLSAAEVIAICEFRQTLESAALKMSMARAPGDLVDALSFSVAAMESARAARARTAYLDADTAFHEAFFACCGNPYLIETYALYVGKIAALRTHLAVKPAHTDKSYAEHREMLALLRSGELQAALEVLDTHIARTKTTYSTGVEDIAAADRGAAVAKAMGSGLTAVPPQKSTGTS
jgi:DNA-binding GntR family transcriptional regulator